MNKLFLKKFNMGNYKEQLEPILKEIYLERKISEFWTFDNYIANLFQATGINYETLSESIDQGIEEGFPLDLQLIAVREYLMNKK